MSISRLEFRTLLDFLEQQSVLDNPSLYDIADLLRSLNFCYANFVCSFEHNSLLLQFPPFIPVFNPQTPI